MEQAANETTPATSQTTELATQAPAEVFKHNFAKFGWGALIDILLVDPLITLGQLAKQTGYSESWLSKVTSSDAFQAQYAKRRADTVDAVVMAKVDDKLSALASRSLDIVLEKLDGEGITADFALRSAEVALKAAGYGAKVNSGPAQQVNFVVALPSQAKSSDAWLASRSHSNQGGNVTDIAPKEGNG